MISAVILRFGANMFSSLSHCAPNRLVGEEKKEAKVGRLDPRLSGMHTAHQLCWSVCLSMAVWRCFLCPISKVHYECTDPFTESGVFYYVLIETLNLGCTRIAQGGRTVRTKNSWS